MKRQASQSASFNTDFSMIRLDKEETKESGPVMIAGQFIQVLRSSNINEIKVRAKNPSSPANLLPDQSFSNAIPLSDIRKMPQSRGREIELNILGIRTGPHKDECSPKTFRKHNSPLHSPKKQGRLMHLCPQSQVAEDLPLDFIIRNYGLSTRNPRKLAATKSINSLHISRKSRKETFSNAALHICSSTGMLNKQFVFESEHASKNRGVRRL